MDHARRAGFDDPSAAAFEIVRADGSPTPRRREREQPAEGSARALRDEAGRLADDEHDRNEMRIIREQLAELGV